MCGLLVIFNCKKINYSKDNFIFLLKSINHRGPDNTGIFNDKNIQKYLFSNSSPNYFSSNLINSYLKDKKNNNISNAYVWFRYYQINKLKDLKNL